ncbi:hypothetical protein E1B28_010588 [Marasmius oreades]|uniref:ABC transmembrane type-1 domain-containing protein n=1 Tax=Marasmius oreades TaxID=181124 RepID=A0A9P7USU9_9AGAR|nr:uncharacterized protein E1B28_010588 [Marasmius oreades]KAG7091561.1 hypothetical protein E1B28_010588 [Marasmius oreades]
MVAAASVDATGGYDGYRVRSSPYEELFTPFTMRSRDFFYDSALLPIFSGALSLSVLTVVTLTKLFRGNKTRQEDDLASVEDAQNLKNHILSHGGIVRFGLQVLRFISSVALVCIGGFTFATAYDWDYRVIASNANLVYICVLSLAVVVASPKWSDMVTRHVNLLLVVTLLVYTYRDLFPLATYTLHPKDHEEGLLLWWKIGVVAAATALPLAMPRQYKPVNPNKPSPNPNPEQTATLFSLIFFFFLDPLILAASRVTHLTADQLPPLADYDAADYLREKVQKHVPSFNRPDSFVQNRPRRHIFWTLLWLVKYEYLWMMVMVVIFTLGKFAIPVALNQLLRFMEANGEPAFIRPWFWVAMLFVGPNIGSMAIERYMFEAFRILTHLDSILSQAVFSHALRIRMKVDGSPLSARPNSNENVEATSNSKPGTHSSSLVGKINNLVTTDVSNVLEGSHVTYLFTYVPLQFTLSLLFLYSVLGWSAFVAFGTMLILLPVLLILANITHRIQKEKMKKTDERVQLVSETTKVIRMVKLFGWETKMSEAIAEKREEELKWIRKLMLLQAMTRVANFLIPVITMAVSYFT